MSNKIQSDDEMRFLEIWDRIRKRIASPQCEMQEFPSMLDTLTYYSKLAQENCKSKDREIYSALCCVLREEVVKRKEHFDETSKYINASTVADSGFGTFHSESEYGSKLIVPSSSDIDQKVTSRRTKCIKARSQKILVQEHKKHRNLMHDASVVNNVFNGKEKDVKLSTNTYPCMVTAIICCFACLIAVTPHRFFPWFFTLISFNSPPPL